MPCLEVSLRVPRSLIMPTPDYCSGGTSDEPWRGLFWAPELQEISMKANLNELKLNL